MNTVREIVEEIYRKVNTTEELPFRWTQILSQEKIEFAEELVYAFEK